MKKILIVVPSLGIGGQERIAINMADCLKSDYDVKLVIFQSKEKEYFADTDVINLNVPVRSGIFKKIFTQLKRAKKLKKIIKNEKADIVFSLGATANLTNALLKKQKNVKKIVAIHGFAEVKKSRINSFIFKRADKIVTISQEMRYRLMRLYPKLENTVVIENGYKIADNLDFENRIYDAEKPKFVSMGRLENVKGFDRLIRAFAIIIKSIPQARLSIIGDGSERDNLKSLVKTLGIDNSVEFLGYKAEPLKELMRHDIYLLTSRNEGFPNCLIEALNCGLTVVAVDCLSGPKEILSEKYEAKPIEDTRFEKYGVLVENDDYEDGLIERFAKAAVDIAQREEKVAEYRKMGKMRSEDFSLEVFNKKLTNLFEDVMG